MPVAAFVPTAAADKGTDNAVTFRGNFAAKLAIDVVVRFVRPDSPPYQTRRAVVEY